MECDCVATTTPTPTPTPDPPQIDDATDTLVFDESSYKYGDTATMTAGGTNIGDSEWSGKVTFTIMQPDGTTTETLEVSGVTVSPGVTGTAVTSFTLPTTGPEGVWTAQSRWIDDDGILHALSGIIDFGKGDSVAQTWVYVGVVLFLALIYLAYRRPKGGR